jgi:hypothetical protein
MGCKDVKKYASPRWGEKGVKNFKYEGIRENNRQ